MTFTLVSHLRESLSSLVVTRAENRRKQERERERIALEVANENGHLFVTVNLSSRKKGHELAEHPSRRRHLKHGRLSLM